MSNTSPEPRQWNGSSSAPDALIRDNHSMDNQSMFRLLFERSADAILLLDPDKQLFVDCNQAAVEMLRATSRQQILQTHPADFSPEFQPDGRSSQEKTPEMVGIAMANGSHRFEWRVRRLDGTEFPIEVLGVAIQTGDHPLLAVICRDITERKQAEDALRESEARFRSLFERSADAISLFDPQTGRFTESNEAVARLTGAPNSEALSNATPAEISPLRQPDGRLSSEKAEEMVRLALANGSHRFEWVARRHDGTEQPLDIVMTAIPIGQRPQLLVVSRDISSHKRAEKEILQLNASLEKRVAERTIELVQTNDHLKRTEKELRQRGHQVQKHRDVLLELAQADKSDFSRALQRICSLAAATLDVARVSYWSLQENNSAIVCELLQVRDAPDSDDPSRGVRLGVSDCPAYFQALAARRPIVAHDTLRHPATGELVENYLKPLGISSMLDAPVWVRGEVVGVLCHEHIGPAREWSAEEIDFVSALAAMVSLTVEESNRARSERLLRESEEKFRALFETSSHGIIVHDEEKIIEVNPAGIRILGCRSADELIGKHPAASSAPIQPNGERADVLARKYIEECLTRGSARFDWVACTPRGDQIPIEVVLTRIAWGGQQLIQAVFNDISERKRAEAELRASEARLRESDARFSAAFRASPVFITISRFDDGRYVLANEAFLNWTDRTLEEVLGRNSAELALWADPAEREIFWEELRRHQSIRERECRVRNRHGRIYTMLLSADIIEVNRVPHLLTVGIDITQRKQAEAELLRTLAREKELGSLRSNFVSMVSHEFRTPLGIIQSSAEILEGYLDQLEPAERREHLESIRKNTRRMAGLMEEVLLIGSIDAGRMDFKPGPFDPGAFIRRLVDEVSSATDRRCPIELSLTRVPAEGQGDERLLRHIFTNLLTNAVKYSEAGRPVRFEVACHGTELIATIRDRGIGIPEADQEWLFNAFHRGRNVGERPGTGLGLVIVKRCVDLHGGRIKVDSKPGEGTVVTVRLPKLPTEKGDGKEH
jgi:PAS domain S-box-containing protein